MTEIILPVLDENVTEYKIAQWLKQVGDSVALNEPILEVDTDKVTMEVVAELAGVLGEQAVAVGDTVLAGAVLGRMNVNGSAESPQPTADTTHHAPRTTHSDMSTKMTPVVARMVAEHNVDITQIDGTGRGGRVTKRDVQAFLETRKTEPAPQPQQPKPVAPKPVAPKPVPMQPVASGSTIQPMTGMRRSIAEHMVRSLQTSPHVTTVFEIDFGAVADHRKQNKKAFAAEGIKLTYMAYIMHATAQALRRFPTVNASFREEGIEVKQDVNIGLIVAVEDGLFAPVVHHADQLNLRGLAARIGDIATRGRDGQLNAADLQNGTFTISNHGSAGSLLGTPIIFQPQAGILGVGAIEERVKVVNGGIHVRPMAYISFSFDHRVMDGAIADGFVVDIKRQIESWQ